MAGKATRLAREAGRRGFSEILYIKGGEGEGGFPGSNSAHRLLKWPNSLYRPAVPKASLPGARDPRRSRRVRACWGVAKW